MTKFIEHLKVLRIDHWLKNIFILFGQGVALVLVAGLRPEWGDWPAIRHTAALAAFSLVPACLVASANYILNEILDAPFDRLHPTKCFRPVPAGTVSVPALYVTMAALAIVAFALSLWFFNHGYTIALALLLASGLVYNIPPVRLKDRPYLDVISESFNNPIRLWLGWYALAPVSTFPPLSIVMAWWFFGALLMAGKRYAEFRFIGDAKTSGDYRKSFQVYTERSLVISMITYANFFCFCMGIGIAVYRPNLIFVFPVAVLAIIVYFQHAMSTEGAKLEPEQLMRNPLLILCTIVTASASLVLAFWPSDLTKIFRFLEPIGF